MYNLYLQALRDVLLHYPGGGLERPQVDDELVRAEALPAAVEYVEVPVQLGGHVVSVQDCQLRHTSKTDGGICDQRQSMMGGSGRFVRERLYADERKNANKSLAQN